VQKPPTFRPYQIRWANDTSRLAMMVKATQIGVSTATGAWAIFKRCLRIPNHLVILLSRSERQSLELARKCKGLIDAYEGIKADLYEGRQFQRTEKKQHEIEFPNGARIIALAANPDTARGYTGDMVLDEFAFHQDAEAIYKSAYGRMTNPGYQMRVVSTPNGAQGKFHALAQQMALDGGFRPHFRPAEARVDRLVVVPLKGLDTHSGIHQHVIDHLRAHHHGFGGGGAGDQEKQR